MAMYVRNRILFGKYVSTTNMNKYIPAKPNRFNVEFTEILQYHYYMFRDLFV